MRRMSIPSLIARRMFETYSVDMRRERGPLIVVDGVLRGRSLGALDGDLVALGLESTRRVGFSQTGHDLHAFGSQRCVDKEGQAQQ
jgi:hypothetical protein